MLYKSDRRKKIHFEKRRQNEDIILIFFYTIHFAYNFIILNQVVAEKTLTKNLHMCYIGVTEEKYFFRKKDDKMRVSILIFIYTILFAYLKVYTKFHNHESSSF